MGGLKEAATLYGWALEIREKTLPPDHPDIATSLDNLGRVKLDQNLHVEAEAYLTRALQIRETSLPPGHPLIGDTVGNLALVRSKQGRLQESEALNRRALALYEAIYPQDHPRIATILNNLAALYFEQRNWTEAASLWRRSMDITRRRALRVADSGRPDGRSGPDARRNDFLGFMKATFQLDAKTEVASEAFQAAQWSLASQAAEAVAQMAARGATAQPDLASVVRERQDITMGWQRRDLARTAALSRPLANRSSFETENVARLAQIEARIAEIDKRLGKFPDYVALARPDSLTVQDVQAQLGPGEALVLFLDTDKTFEPTLSEETFVWIVTKTDMRWVRSELGTAAMTREVAALRCGLDAAAWETDGGSKCAGLLNITPDKVLKGDKRLPFDVGRAHALYKALFGQLEDLIRGKHLVIVPSGPLTQLPFHVLVTEPVKRPASATSLRRAACLARKHAITVLPAVSSLKALRRVARPSAAAKPMIGFGNPLLDGDPVGRPSEVQLVKLSREKQACRPTPWQRVAGLVDKRRSVERVPLHGGHADLEHLRFQVPLHETADELCAVARDLRLEPDDILLGARATETNVKQLSNDGKLNAYRVVHFATHGTVAGEIEGTTEPGFILTPPDTATDLDDGYLSASEVASLKLDADWVILSACNTAAGGARGAEALSGLARALIYAGARSLLVSHWAVPSAATAKLVSTAIGATARDKRLGRAEALRRAMLAMIDKGEPHEVHPSYWAPFIVVGEGQAAR